MRVLPIREEKYIQVSYMMPRSRALGVNHDNGCGSDFNEVPAMNAP